MIQRLQPALSAHRRPRRSLHSDAKSERFPPFRDLQHVLERDPAALKTSAKFERRVRVSVARLRSSHFSCATSASPDSGELFAVDSINMPAAHFTAADFIFSPLGPVNQYQTSCRKTSPALIKKGQIWT